MPPQAQIEDTERGCSTLPKMAATMVASSPSTMPWRLPSTWPVPPSSATGISRVFPPALFVDSMKLGGLQRSDLIVLADVGHG